MSDVNEISIAIVNAFRERKMRVPGITVSLSPDDFTRFYREVAPFNLIEPPDFVYMGIRYKRGEWWR